MKPLLLALPLLLVSCASLLEPATPDGSPPPGVADPTPGDPYDKLDAGIATAQGANNASQPINPLYTGIGATLAAAAAAWGAYKKGLKTDPETGKKYTPKVVVTSEVETPSN